MIPLTRKFLYQQFYLNAECEIPDSFYTLLDVNLKIFHAATAVFYSPSDPSGIEGMRREQIRSTPQWRKYGHRYDTIFVETDPNQSGMRGMHVARVYLFFSFAVESITYPCALIHWYGFMDNEPDPLTGMWMVSQEYVDDQPSLAVIHMDTILRGAHLIPAYGEGFVADAHELDSAQTLDNFNLFYVNKFVDHHSFEMVF